MNDDDPKKPRLPRAGWTDDEARKQERERVSKLLDEESTPATGPADDPEAADVYGLPSGDADDQRGPVMAVYGMPMVARRDDVEAAPVYGMPSSSELTEVEPVAAPTRSPWGAVAAVVLLVGAAIVAWVAWG
jgi:hypothetical protein